MGNNDSKESEEGLLHDDMAEEGTDSPIKLVFVAGATGGTGKRVVKELVKRGVLVRAGVRSTEKGEAVLKELEIEAGKVELVRCSMI